MGEEREETRTVAQIVGQNMRRVREEWGKVLNDVASAAREIGLTWDASAVSRIETGKRELTLEEFLALPLILTVALDRTVTLSDLLGVGLEDEETTVRSYNDEHVLLISVLMSLAEPLTAYSLKYKSTWPPAAIGELVRGFLDRDKRDVYLARAPDETDRLEQFLTAAQELGVHPTDVMDAAQALARSGRWNEHSWFIQDERERRLRDSGEDLSNPTRVRTLRGHITRQLTAELRDYFAEHPPKRTLKAKTPAEKEN